MSNDQSFAGATGAMPVANGPTAEGRAAHTLSTPKPENSAPGILRLKLGDAVVTALLDGSIDLPLALFPRTGEAEAISMLKREFTQPPIRAALNAFLVQGGGHTALIDTGAATGLGSSLGRLPAALEAAGVNPASIDTVALTHLHADHVNGLLTPDGHAAFPNAELVLHAAEQAFWTDDGARSRAPAGLQPFFDAARTGITPYARRTRLLSRADEVVVPGVTAVPLPGHTPGHTGYRVASDGRELLIWGDIVHAAALQFAHPAWGIAFDVDMDEAAATRLRTMDMAVADRVLIAGMHLDFPAFGRVQSGIVGAAYRFLPLAWQTAFSASEP